MISLQSGIDPGLNRAEAAFEKLQEAIVTGQLRPNQRLIESELAQSLGMSRTPVREALKLLVAKGYASALPSGGLIVTDHTPSQIRNLFEIREALETMIVKLACQRATEEQLRRIEECHLTVVEHIHNRDVDGFMKANGAFHDLIFATCGNEQLQSLAETYHDQYFDRRIIRALTGRDWRTQILEHTSILEALLARNAARAEKAVRRHLKTSLRVALERL